MPVKGRSRGDGKCDNFIKACREEIEWRKYLFNHPEEVWI